MDSEQRHLTLAVSVQFIKDLKIILKREVHPKAMYNTTRVYLFLLWMNCRRLSYVPREDLAEMTFSKHEDRLTKAIDSLKSLELLEVELQPNQQNPWYHYKYHAKAFITEYKTCNDMITYDYAIPERTMAVLMNTPSFNDGAQQSQTLPQSSDDAINETQCKIDESVPLEEFQTVFTNWYTEITIPYYLNQSGHFSQKDGRFYHPFHGLSKEDRMREVLWDGENIVEVWDASAAFFTVLCYYLKYHKEYESEDEQIAFIEEADKLLDYTLNDKLYDAVKNYCLSVNARWGTTRDAAKTLCQSYKNMARSTLFRKTDGHLKNIWWAQKFKGVDEFFQSNFPRIRDLFLDYPRHQEEDPNHKVCKYDPNTNQYALMPGMKKVSNLQRDILPYEFSLISLGVCKDLYEQYGIKTLTVHDAIYMKETDARKQIDINFLLRKRLGKTSLMSTPLF